MTPFNTFGRLNGIYHMSGQYLFQTSFQITNRANKFRAINDSYLASLRLEIEFYRVAGKKKSRFVGRQRAL